MFKWTRTRMFLFTYLTQSSRVKPRKNKGTPSEMKTIKCFKRFMHLATCKSSAVSFSIAINCFVYSIKWTTEWHINYEFAFIYAIVTFPSQRLSAHALHVYFNDVQQFHLRCTCIFIAFCGTCVCRIDLMVWIWKRRRCYFPN